MEPSLVQEKSAEKQLHTHAEKICIIKYTIQMGNSHYTAIDDIVKKQGSLGGESHSFAKEAEPFARKKEIHAPLQEAVEHESQEKEVKQFVTPKPETIKLPPDLKSLGIESVDTTHFPSYQNVKLPIPDEEVIEDLKQPVTSTKRWLGELAKYLLLKAHLVLKTVGGKVVRIIKY